MSLIRRGTALLTSILVLQLTLLGAVAPCNDHGARGPAAEIPGSAGHAEMADASSSEQHDCGDTQQEKTGTTPASYGCIAMLSCVTPLLAVASPLAVDDVVVTTVAAASILQPPTRSTAPELPPPRA